MQLAQSQKTQLACKCSVAAVAHGLLLQAG